MCFSRLGLAAILLAALPGTLRAHLLRTQAPRADFEIVESAPLETSLDDPDIRNTLEVWLEMIRSASASLDIEQFYVSDEEGEALSGVITAIEEAARRGVTVRLIADSKFARTYPKTLERLGKHEHATVRLIDFSKVSGDGVQHAKYFIADGREIYLGSANFDWRALTQIREIGMHIRHTRAVACYQALFDLDWQLCEVSGREEAAKVVAAAAQAMPSSFEMPGADGHPLRFHPTWTPAGASPDPAHWTLDAILQAIRGSRRAIAINLLSFTPVARDRRTFWPDLENALEQAAVRGVKVRLLLSDWNNSTPKIDYIKSFSLFPGIDVRILSIPDHSSGFIPFARVTHAKYMTIDGMRCWVGSANWQRDYFFNSRNVGVMVESAEVTETLQRIFERDWKSPYATRVDPARRYKPRRIAK